MLANHWFILAVIVAGIFAIPAILSALIFLITLMVGIVAALGALVFLIIGLVMDFFRSKK